MKTDDDLERRIKTVIALADRREQFYVTRNRDGLMSLADEYARRGMHNMAREIRLEAGSL